jgi:hypothetical protein
MPSSIEHDLKKHSTSKDFGSLSVIYPYQNKFWFWRTKSLEREIRTNDDWFWETEYRPAQTPVDDDFDAYLAPGDDYLWEVVEVMKEKEEEDDEEEEEEGEEEPTLDHNDEAVNVCRRTSEHRLSFPNCNTFHEISLVDSQIQYLGYV